MIACRACGDEWIRDPALEVPCPVCREPIGAKCKRPSGHACPEPHYPRDAAALRAGFMRPCPAVDVPAPPIITTEPGLFDDTH